MKKIQYIISILFLVSCTSNTIYEKPKDLIPKDTMIALINDMIIAKVAKNQKNKNQEVKISYMPLVYNKYKIDSTRFANSNFYYTSKIDIYEEIMLIVKERLSKQEEIYGSKLKIKDSLERTKLKTIKNNKIKKLSKQSKKGGKLLDDDKLVIPVKNY